LVIRSGCFVSSFAGRAVEGVEIGLACAKATEAAGAPVGCGTALLEVRATGVGGGFVSFVDGLMDSSGSVVSDSFDAKPSDGRAWCVGIKASPFVEVTIGVEGTGE
jgi:hypothetical protein